MIKEIAQKIIDILKADTSLAFDWFFEPPVRAPRFPYGFVDFSGGEVQRWRGPKGFYSFTYYIVLIDRKRNDTDQTEEAVMDRTEKAMSILRDNQTLGGLVEHSKVTAVEGDYAITEQGNLIGTRITLTVSVWI